MDKELCDNCNKVTVSRILTNEEHPEYNWKKCTDCGWTFVCKGWLKQWKIKERPKA
jgi:hypothetical protein